VSKKAKVLFWGFAVLTLAALYIMPRMVTSSIPSIYYVTPNQTTYENIVSCNGTIQASQASTIYLDSAIVAGSVYVSVGDRVEEGDLLISIDQDRTKQLSLSPLYFLQELAGDTLTQQTDQIDWASLASSYGLSATVTGGAEDYSQDVVKILEDIGVLSYDTDVVGAFAPAIDGSVYAPVAGVVTDVTVRQNVPVSAGKALLTLSDDSGYKVVAQVSESDISSVNVGDGATVRGVGFNGTYTGEVVKIYPTARKTISGTTTETVVDVEIRLDNPDQNLKPGFTAKVEITGGDDYDLITVPYEAIRQDENNDEYVYIYEDGKIKKTLVTTGKELTNEVQILTGLKDDSIVVYNPGDIAKEGIMIQIEGRADVD